MVPSCCGCSNTTGTSTIYRITKTFRDKNLLRNAVQQGFTKKGFVKGCSIKQSGAAPLNFTKKLSHKHNFNWLYQSQVPT